MRYFALPLLLCAFTLPTTAHEGHEHGEHGEHDHEHGEQPKGFFTTRGESRTLPPAKEEDVFHFVVYGDRTGGVPEGLKVLEQAVIDTNLLDPDMVLTVGDLIQGYNETDEWMEQMTEYKAIMDRLSMQWFPVAGNHDVYWRGKTPPPPGQHEASYEKHFGPLWYTFAHKNAGFVVLYSDEGDPETNVKGFNEGRLQTMSDAQLEFLRKACEQHKDLDHVFVFLHHPRWIGRGYTGGNWDVVHDILKSAGNVSAVFAGHIHQMRFDGPKDGIAYYTLATTGGHLSADIPGAGYLHHLNMVTVRPDSVTVAGLPVGSVIDPTEFTPELLAEVEQARSIRPEQLGNDLLLNVDGSAGGTMTFAINNPSTRPVDVTVSLEQTGGDWKSTLDHDHFTLPAGERKTIDVAMRRLADPESTLTIPRVRLDMQYVGESSRISLPPITTPVAMKLAVVPANYFDGETNQCLEVASELDAVRIESAELNLPDGAFTLEAWLNPSQSAGMRAAIAKTQVSEFAIFLNEGVPQFDVHLNDRYVSAEAMTKLPVKQWSHVAGVFDGSEVRIYVDGKKVASKPGSGKRTRNELPLYIGADPSGGGAATRAFLGRIDEVRITDGAAYTDDFSPIRRLTVTPTTRLMMHLDRTLGPFVLDHSSSATMGLLGYDRPLVPVE